MAKGAVHAALERARQQNRASFIAYAMAGYPDAATSVALVLALAAAGADVIELGVPFSDPLADGATIQHASQGALAAGMTFAGSCDVARQVTAATTVPVVLMGSYNPFLHMGLPAACALAQAAGVTGIIVPDLPVEEAGPLVAAANAHDISPIFLITPTSPEYRMAQVAQAAGAADSAFIYCVSLSGVTGARAALAGDLPDFIGRVRLHAPAIPLVVGFGIGTPAQVANVANLADGVAIGSALINCFDEADPAARVATVAAFAQSLRAATAHR